MKYVRCWGVFDSALPDFSLGCQVVPFFQRMLVHVSHTPLNECNGMMAWQGCGVDEGLRGPFPFCLVL